MRRLAAALLLVSACDDPARTLVPMDAAPRDASDASLDAAVDAGPSGVGLGCSDERDLTEVSRGCRGGQLCFTSAHGYPGGYCTQDCTRTPCPGDAFCIDDNSEHYCLQRCTDDAQCRTAEGYICEHPAPLLPRACIPDPAPLGTGPGGRACFDPADGGVSGLPARTFRSGCASVSHDRADSDSEAQPSIAVSPRTGAVVVAYDARTARQELFVGVSHVTPPGAWSRDGSIVDRNYVESNDPQLAYAPDGTLFATYLASTPERPQPAMQFLRSADDGATWSAPVDIVPDGYCAGGCDPPWLALGPAPAGSSTPRIHVAYITRSTRRDAWVTVQRSDDGGATWTPPVHLAAVLALTSQIALEPAYPTIAAAPDGKVWVAWAMVSRANARAVLGDVHNRVQVAFSGDGGAHFGDPATVSSSDVAVVSQPPQLAVARGVAHVVYVTGAADARWNVVLGAEVRTATDARWVSTVVNDDPVACATHGYTAVAGDDARGLVHVLWEDDRFGGGEVAYTGCVAGSPQRCAPNEVLSDAHFDLSTTADVTRWAGTHNALAVGPDGALWAAWSDTRTGGPAVYVARGTP